MALVQLALLRFPVGRPLGPHHVDAPDQVLVQVLVRLLVHERQLADAAPQDVQVLLGLVGVVAHLRDQLA